MIKLFYDYLVAIIYFELNIVVHDIIFRSRFFITNRRDFSWKPEPLMVKLIQTPCIWS